VNLFEIWAARCSQNEPTKPSYETLQSRENAVSGWWLRPGQGLELAHETRVFLRVTSPGTKHPKPVVLGSRQAAGISD